ncbi:MAG: phosphoribosylamine--glycine ligase [Thermoanaerobaculia bacterium]
MKVLVVGNGGREHALCWKLATSPLLDTLYCAPGSPGTRPLAQSVEVAVDDLDGLVSFVRREEIDLTVVGPELPLTLGLVDRLRAVGSAAFGPDAAAARLEGSKAFAKELMVRSGIPTARFSVAGSRREAESAIARFGLPVVLKADGLAAGKGVFVVEDRAALAEALDALYDERRFGPAADAVVVEECLVGEEVSMIALSDGSRLLPCATSKDYKRIGDGDEGPNTGGMGAHSPSGVLDAAGASRVEEVALRPVLEGMDRAGTPFVGVLYAGLMLTADGPRVLEFNVRFGDPECQPLMLRLDDDLLPALAAGAAGDFGTVPLRFSRQAAACVVLANEGYPGKPRTGDPIEGIDRASERGVVVFHAGTSELDGAVVATGGRVLGVCAREATLGGALESAYAGADEIHWPHRVLRRDIGARVVAGGVVGDS